MSFKVIKKGQYAYKRSGRFKTDYRVMFRKNGIYLNEKLLDIINDDDALTKSRRRISLAEEEKTEKDLIQKQIKEKSPLVRFETIMDQVIASKPFLPTRKAVEYYLKRTVLPLLNKHCPFVQDFGPTGPEDFVTWFQNERPGQKIFNPRKYFLQVLKRAKKLGLLNPDVVLEINNPDPKRRAGKVYSDEEIALLFEHAKGDLKLQILMALSMGMRKSEILKLRWDRMNIFRQTIALRPEDTKIREGREFKVNTPVWTLLNARKATITSDYVFPSPRDDSTPVEDNKSAWQSCKRRTKVMGRFHDLRHTFLTIAVARNKDQAMDICIYAGLSLEELKRTYLHPTYLDTAYIADSQGESVSSIINMYKLCNTFRNNLEDNKQYA